MTRFTVAFIAALSAITFAGAASAQTIKAKNLAAVADASRNNEARFERDYKGKVFEDAIAFDGMERPVFGGEGYNVRLGPRTFLHDAECRITDGATINMLIDKNAGDMLRVKGIIDYTVMGVINLSSCSIRP